MSEPIFERVWDAFTEHLHPAHYHQPVTTATPATEAPAMTIATFEADAEQALATVQALVRDKLPAALAGAKKIEPVLSSKLVDALLGAAHVPVGEIEALVIPTINWLANAYDKPAADVPAADPPADPAADVQPEPAAA